MERKFKRGYIEKGWWNPLTNRWENDLYAISISKVVQRDDFGEWEDDEEDEVDGFGGYTSEEEALEELKSMKVKEIYNENNELIWSKLK